MGRLCELAVNRRTDYSDDWPAPVQRRYTMPQRSPVIFWLLLAATVAIDAVVFAWMVLEPYPKFAAVAYDALVVGQLSVICIWSALTLAKTFWVRVAPLVAALLASVAMGMFGVPPRATSWLAYYGLHTALLLAAMWLFARTSFWRGRSGNLAKWRYSLAHLLVAMTVVAVLAAAMRGSELFDREGWINLAFILWSVILAVVSVVCWSLSGHWLLRLAGVLGLALLFGVGLSVFEVLPVFPFIIGSHYLIQGIILSVWLGCGPILPVRHVTRPVAA